MKFTEITTPYEKKKMLLFKSSGNGITSRFVEVRHVADAIYMGKVEKREGCSYESCDIYFCLAACDIGICIGGTPVDEDVQEVCGRYSCFGSGSEEEFIAHLDSREREGIFIPKNMLALAEVVKPEKIARYAASNEDVLRQREEQRAVEEAARKQKDAAYVEERNREAQAKIDAAVHILQNDGALENTVIEIFRSRYNHSVYSVINYLLRQYGINVPLRTQGWINSKLVTATIENGACEYLQYRRSKNGRCSQAVFGCLTELAQAVRKETKNGSVA